jgi:hypothetical protein
VAPGRSENGALGSLKLLLAWLGVDGRLPPGDRVPAATATRLSQPITLSTGLDDRAAMRETVQRRPGQPLACRRSGTSRTAYPTGGAAERARAQRFMTAEGHWSGDRVLRNVGDETGVDVESGPDPSAPRTFPTRFADR